MTAVTIKTKPSVLSTLIRQLTTGASLAVFASTVSLPAMAQDEPEVEEVVVTGSFIRRSEGFTAASPVTTISSEDLQAEGTVNMGQVVQNMTFNAGSATTNTIQGTSSNTTAFNLRGLGSSATLLLMDGKRTPTSNVNVLLPNIAVQRMEIVTDGAAALYGTDAVAGVVNMVPYTSYDGIKTELYYEQDDGPGSFNEKQISTLFGTEIAGEIDFVGAFAFREADPLRWIDRPDLMKAGLTSSGTSNPGNWSVPQRDEMGNLTGVSANRPDPSCSTTRDDPAQIGANPFGFQALGSCWMDFGDTRDFREQNDIMQVFTNATWDVSSDLTLSGQLMYTRQTADRRTSPSNPGGRTTALPTVRGELPGNPFRAVNASGNELFAEPRRDNAGNIVTDGYGRPLPLRGADNNVVLAQNQFANMNSDPMGGVPFYEDLPITRWRAVGKADTCPVQNAQDGSCARQDKLDRRYTRVAFDAQFTVPYLDGWEGQAGYSFSRMLDLNTESQVWNYDAIAQGLTCDVVNDVDACFNPFGVTDPQFATSQAVMDQVGRDPRRRYTDDLQTFDLVFNGTIPLGSFELPGGEIGAAFGLQRREESLERIPDALTIAGEGLLGAQVAPFSRSRSVDAVMAEFLLPLASNWEVNIAARNESFSTGQEDSIVKVGTVYEPTDWLGLRATWGEAFLAPTMNQLEAPRDCGLTLLDDLFSSFNAYVNSCQQGNPNLESETSESWTLGVDLVPTDNLTLTLNYSETDFSNRIVSTTTQDLMRKDFENFKIETGFTPTTANPYPTEDQIRNWVANPASDDRIIRAPNDIGFITEVIQSDSNASAMLVKAYDITADYLIPTNEWGEFGLNLSATMVDSYQFQLDPLDPVIEAVGNHNNDYGAVPAMPEWRANLRATWRMGDHFVAATTRYVDEVNYDANNYSFQQYFPHSNWRDVDTIRAWTQMDWFYTYSGLEIGDGQTGITVGMRNAFDREPQKVGMTSGIVGELQDPLGRVMYARMSYDF
ncbi:TonB-dependent receptor domain-containing protein [Pseudohongiella nitratireducens]|uniref:TonB-dependent receptor domain-containing protein n=1 Tax=Pseudohongiella nitratireducens TaxID=1768907 RepID=UPI0030EBDFFC